MLFNQPNTNLNQSTLFTSNANALLSNANPSLGTTSQDSMIYVNSPNDTPKDSIEQIEFSPVVPTIFSLISWDSTFRVYEISNNQINQKMCVQLPAYPLCFAWRSDGNAVYISLSNNSIQMVDFSTGNLQKFADCQTTIHKMKSAPSLNALVAFDISNNLKIYVQGNPNPVFNLQIKYPVIEVDISDSVLLMILGDSYSAILDLNSINQYNPNDIVYTESQLKSPLSSCAINAKTMDFVLTSVDGRTQKGQAQSQTPQMGQNKRIYSTVFSPNLNQQNYVFIAHSTKSRDNTSDMFQINKCGFNSRSDNFSYTAGSDGVLNFWDLKVKNKITTISLGNPITACAINSQGNYLAVATGYDWSKGVWGLNEVNYRPKLGIRFIKDNELVFGGGASTFR